MKEKMIARLHEVAGLDSYIVWAGSDGVWWEDIYGNCGYIIMSDIWNGEE